MASAQPHPECSQPNWLSQSNPNPHVGNRSTAALILMRVEGKRAPRAMPCLLRHAMLATRLASCCTRGLGHVPGYRWDLQRAVQAPRAMPMLCSCSSSSAVATVAAPAAAAVSTASASMSPMLFRQLFDTESSTYTYLLADSDTKEALLIDPVVEHVARWDRGCCCGLKTSQAQRLPP